MPACSVHDSTPCYHSSWSWHEPGLLTDSGKVQGFMFRASFMKNIPLFIRNFTENVILCMVAAGVETTSTAFTKKISLHWRERLTNTVHKTYFQNMVCLHF